MRVDDFDCTLVCEDDDLQTVLALFKEHRNIPEYLEIAVLKITLEKLYERPMDFSTVNEYLIRLPDGFVSKTILDIKTMFSSYTKADYQYSHLSYLLYYLPANIFKVWKPLLDLLLTNTLKPRMRFLDVGTGPGSIPIGIIEFYRVLAERCPRIDFSLSFVVVEAESEFIDIAARIIAIAADSAPKNLAVRLENAICKRVALEDDYTNYKIFDIITLSNFLHANEGENQKNAMGILKNLRKNIGQEGSLIVIEPGEADSCRALKRIRNELSNNRILNVFSPCVGIWEEKIHYDCACFNMVRCYWHLPLIYEYLVKRGLSKAKRVDVPFNYVVFRKDNLKKYIPIRNSQFFVKLAELRFKIGQVVNLIARIRTVVYNGNEISLSLCDGSCIFSEDKTAIWLKLSEEELRRNGIVAPLISAERITLKKVLVNLKGEQIKLEVSKSSRISIDY